MMTGNELPSNNAGLSGDVFSEALAKEEASGVSNDGAKSENAVIADNAGSGLLPL
jgi:hypothetical protein